jgi:aldehyde:ferredoxin oxidoreductase
VVELDTMLDEYYSRMGWDANGVPTSKRLEELGLDQLLLPLV